MNNRNMLRGPLSNESEVTNQLRPQSSDNTSPINKHLIDVMMHTTQEWQDREGYIPPEDSMAIYIDYRITSGGIDIPGIKIGDGATPIEDLPFITDWEDEKIRELEDYIRSLFLGETTTALYDGYTNPSIVIDGEVVVANNGNIAVYNRREFIWDESNGKWVELGMAVFVPGTGTNSAQQAGTGAVASGDGAVAEGILTVATNEGEHAEGKYNVSIQNVTQHAVGIGTADNARKNAHTITTDGKHYIPGIGTYTGTETTLPSGQDLATIVNGKQETLVSGTNIKTINNASLLGDGNISTGTVISVNTGVGLTGGTVTTSGTIKAKLKEETLNIADSSRSASSDGGLYAVEVDKSGNLAVRVPWTDHTYTVNNGTFVVKGSGAQVSSTSANASSNTSVDIVAGSNVTVTPDATNSKITIAATDTTYSDATTSASGLMPASDKTKLDGIATGATAVSESTVSGWGFTKNAGTVTSVSAGIGLSISGTASTTPTVNIASGYKLPTTTEWNAKAPLASPALTGTPTAPTAAAGTNTTQIATTAFVKNAVDSASTSSENLKTEQKTNQEIVFRKTNVGWNAKAALITKILGRTEAWNQLGAKRPAASFSSDNVTGTYDADGNLTIVVGTGGATGNWAQPLVTLTGAFITGHKYLLAVRADFTPSASTIQIGNNYYSWWNNLTYVWTASGNLGSYSVQVVSGCPAGTYHISNPIIIDLTLMYGAGNEPTADQFRALHPLPYYNPMSKLINNAATGLETTGFNQWDEEWEVGGYIIGTGAPYGYTDRIRSKNAIPVFPSTQYYLSDSNTHAIFFYDADGNYISDTGSVGVNVFTTPANCAFIKFNMFSTYGTTYNHDICINISDASRNGTYEPYWERTLALGLNSIPCHDENNNAVVVNGLDGVGTSYDEAIVENGMVTKIIKRYAEEDLGNRAWTDVGGDQWLTNIPDHKYVDGISLGTGLICSRYVPTANSTWANWDDKQIGATINIVRLKDSAFVGYTGAQVAAALSGVKLRFELATPKVLTLDNPIPALIEVDNLGTEKRLPEDTADNPQAPFECDIQYGINSADIVNSISYLDKKYDFWALNGSVPAGRYSCVKSSGSGITSAVCCNGNIIINGSAGTYVMTLSNFYESFMKSIGGYSLTKASQSDADKIDELAFLMSNSYIIKQPTGTGTSFTRYSNSYQLAAYGSGVKIISFTFGDGATGTRLLIDSSGVTITLV